MFGEILKCVALWDFKYLFMRDRVYITGEMVKYLFMRDHVYLTGEMVKYLFMRDHVYINEMVKYLFR